MNRVLIVYKALGRVLNSPQSLGLGERPPKPLSRRGHETNSPTSADAPARNRLSEFPEE
jgi:hypothetical protein